MTSELGMLLFVFPVTSWNTFRGPILSSLEYPGELWPLAAHPAFNKWRIEIGDDREMRETSVEQNQNEGKCQGHRKRTSSYVRSK